MIPARVFHYRDPAAVALGLRELRKRGLTPRGILSIALNPRGETHIAVPDDFDMVDKIRIGNKMTLKPPWEGRYFHFDAIHRLPGNTVLWNGDRRLSDTGSAPEVACALAEWLKGSSARNVFLGCASHQPGSWWTKDAHSDVIDLHARGLVDTVLTTSGLLARQINETKLFHTGFQEVAKHGPAGKWDSVYSSSLGNVLMLERRVANYRLALTCERGIEEIDVSGIPDEVRQTARIEVQSGLGVVGRIDGGAFAITTGTVEPWGLSNVRPALLVGAPNQTLMDLPRALRNMEDS